MVLFIATRRRSWKLGIPIIGRSQKDDLAILEEWCACLHPFTALRSNPHQSWSLIGDKGYVLSNQELPRGRECVSFELMSEDP